MEIEETEHRNELLEHRRKGRECDVIGAKEEIHSMYFIETKFSKINVFVKFISVKEC